ncbi:hypothetical protein BDW22DRAFT_1339325 [Trametopsis cervina]|nr:hypothetical protein BDW22DRAFT_1339325 [Trametopsis cervina]
MLVTKSRVAWRHRTKKKQVKTLTPAEKKKLLEQCQEKEENIAALLNSTLAVVWKEAQGLFEATGTHSAKFWFEKLMQHSGKKRSAWQTSRWNVFLSKKMKARNDGLAAGEAWPKVNELTMELCNLWKSMFKEAQEQATDDELARIADIKEMKSTSSHSVPLNAFHDTQATLVSVQTELSQLHVRMGLKMLLLFVHFNGQSLTCPQVWTSGQCITDFFQLTTQMSLSDFAGKLECYCLSGLQGTANSYRGELIALKKKTSKLINDKLVVIARSNTMSCMYYVDFEGHITNKLGIVVVGWPLPHFMSPGLIGSRLELQTLYNAWDTGAAYFRCFTPSELKAWQTMRFNSAVANASHVNNPEADACPETDNGVSSSITCIAPSLLTLLGTSPINDPAAESSSSGTPAASFSAGTPAVQPSADITQATIPPLTTVFSFNDQATMPKKQRKQRADKGKKRGPRAKKMSEGAVPATTILPEA